MTIKKEDVKAFLYEGNDEMIDFENKKIPTIHFDFIAQLRLKNDKLITAPPVWRNKIWNWWYTARKAEIEKDILVQAMDSLVGRPSSYRK